MAEIQAFRGIRYDFSKFAAGDLSAVLAPPYDVLSPADKARLLKGDARNIVAIDLPVAPAEEPGPDEAYVEAAATMRQWLDEGTLIRESAPAIYPYSQTFDHAGRSYTRRGVIARLRLERFGQAKVYPHEETFSGPKADRLKLAQACRANLSQVMVLLAVPPAVIDTVYEGLAGSDHAAARLDGVHHRMWVVQDAGKICALRKAAAEAEVFIADGHHRYSTSLDYRDRLMAHQGPLPAEHPANFLACVFISLEDPGLLVLPTHRVLTGLGGLQIEALRRATADVFDWQSMAEGPPSWDKLLDEAGQHALGLVDGATGRRYILKLGDPNLLARYEPGRCPAWRKLDASILHRYLIQEVLAPRLPAGRTPTIRYVKDAAAADRAAAGNADSLAFLLRPTPVAAVREVCRAGDLMPHKSTYFFPKVASGLVIHSLED